MTFSKRLRPCKVRVVISGWHPLGDAEVRQIEKQRVRLADQELSSSGVFRVTAMANTWRRTIGELE